MRVGATGAAFMGGALLLSLVALLPMRLGLDWFAFGGGGLAARAATGTVWNGAILEAHAGPVPLGDLKAKLNFLPLFAGRARLSLRSADGSFAGAVTMTRHGFGFDDVSARLRVGAFLAPMAVSTLEFEDVSAGFANGRCVRAGGRVRAAMLGGPTGLALRSGLSGEVRCDGQAVVLPLVSASGMEQLHIRLFPQGRYRADLLVRPTDEALRGSLLAAGLRPFGANLGMRLEGSF